MVHLGIRGLGNRPTAQWNEGIRGVIKRLLNLIVNNPVKCAGWVSMMFSDRGKIEFHCWKDSNQSLGIAFNLIWN
jgi:hypothetical protein